MKSKIINLNDNNFEASLLETESLVLVEFWAKWCNPCKKITSSLEEVSNEFDDRLIIAKLDVDENSVIASKYNVRSVPTLLLFKNSEILASKIGVSSTEELKKFINTYLS